MLLHVKYVAFQANVCIRKRICHRENSRISDFHCGVRTIFYNKCFTINCAPRKKYYLLQRALSLYKFTVENARAIDIYACRPAPSPTEQYNVVLINLYRDLRAQSSRNLRTGLIMICDSRR